MGLFRKTSNWLRGKKDEAETWIEDKDAQNQAEQEVKRQEKAVREFEEGCAKLVAMRNAVQDRVDARQKQIASLEKAARAYLNHDDEEKAAACAEQMAKAEELLTTAKVDLKRHNQNVTAAEAELSRARDSLQEAKQLAEQIVSFVHIMKGRELSSKAVDNSGLAQLKAMRERQEVAEGKMDALETIRGGREETLAENLVKGAGVSINDRARDILERLKK
jgi:phage shock protein A